MIVITLKKIRIWFKRLFEPWRDLDEVRAEVQAVRAKAYLLAWKPALGQPLKMPGETQLEWQARRDG